ncbi:hypothetical protein RJT34_03713 [Clitoria ternatea]|uniref:C2H2-type domain-containing protein n=1 Tax=Clitoria ternatea TaxID=43366 RepID=A0AAN9KKP5_CLITE
MDSQDQRRTHTAGHESHGVHVCHKCGWPFPNAHPSAKHRRAHKKICGTIEGYKVSTSEGQNHLNGSDDEHVSDDDHKKPGPNSSDTSNSGKGNVGVGEKVVRSEDEVFSDAVADFSDSGFSAETKERLQEDSLDSGTDVERVEIKEPKLSVSSETKDFDAADVSQLMVKLTDDCPQNPSVLPSELAEGRSTVDLQGQLSDPTVNPLSNSIADLKTEDSTIVDNDSILGLSTDSPPHKAEAMPDIFPEENIDAGENATDCSLISVAAETNLKEKDEINYERYVVEFVESSDNILAETSEVSKIAASKVGLQVHDGAVNLKEKDGAEVNSDRDVVEIVESSENIVGEMCEGVPKIAVSDVVSLNHQEGDGTVDLMKEKNGAEFHSLMPQDDLPLELKSVVITNDAQGEFAHVVHFDTSSDVNVDSLGAHNEMLNVTHPQSEYGDLKDHEGIVSQNPFLHSSESLKYEDDLKGMVTEENNFHFNTSQLGEKSDVPSLDKHVIDSSVEMDLVNSEPMPEEVLAEECTEVSPVMLTAVESYQRSDENEVAINPMKTEMNESHVAHLSEDHGPDDHKNSSLIRLSEGSLMVSLNENKMDAPFDSVTTETSVINTDDKSHHEKNRTEINDVAVDDKVVGANVENDIEIILKDLQPGDLLESEVKQSNDRKSEDADEIGIAEQPDIIDTQYRERPVAGDVLSPKSASSHFENPIVSEVVADEPARNSNGTQCATIDPLSGTPKDIKVDEININAKPNEEYNKPVDTSADSYQAQDAELVMKAAADVARNYTSSPLTAEPSTQHESAVEDYPGGEPGREVSGITPEPVQDQTSNNLAKLGSAGIDASVDSSSRCDSLEGNWGSVSVLSMQSDLPGITDAETLPSTGLLAPTEAGKSNSDNPNASSERQQSGQSEMFEPPSFMTLVEPKQVSSKAIASEVQKVQDRQQPDSTSQAGWCPTLTQVVNESQGKKKNEEIIAKVTNWSTSKEHTPLKSLLGEAAHSNKPKSPKVEEISVNQKNSKVGENNGSGLTTVNSILGPESPAAAQVLKGEAAKEWNSPARYPADIKRVKRKSRPYWIQLVCCTSVDPQRR